MIDRHRLSVFELAKVMKLRREEPQTHQVLFQPVVPSPR
jgi:hypothetical protein